MVSWTEPLDPDAPSTRSRPGGRLLLIGLGGAVGTMVRFGVESTMPPAGGGWPFATFLINISGAFILAALLETLSWKGPDDGWRRRIRLGVGTGMLGGYTTYSTFMVETALLGGASHYLIAFGYAAVSVVLGVAAAWTGMAVVTALHRTDSGATA